MRGGMVPALPLGTVSGPHGGTMYATPSHSGHHAGLSTVAAHRRHRGGGRRALSHGRGLGQVQGSGGGLTALSAVGATITKGDSYADLHGGSSPPRRRGGTQGSLAPIGSSTTSPMHTTAASVTTPLSTARSRPEHPTPRAAAGRGAASLTQPAFTPGLVSMGGGRGRQGGGQGGQGGSYSARQPRTIAPLSRGGGRGGYAAGQALYTGGGIGAMTARTRGRSNGRLAALDSGRGREGGMSTSAIAQVAMHAGARRARGPGRHRSRRTGR